MEQVEQSKKRLLEALEAAKGNVTNACASTGIGRTTFYRYLKDDESFRETVADIQEITIDHVEDKLFQRIDGIQMVKYGKEGEEIIYELPPDVTSIIFYLKTKAKHRGYVEKSQVEHQGGIIINVDKDDAKV